MSRPSVVLNAHPRINPILLFAGLYAIIDGTRMLTGHGSLVSIRIVPSSSSDPSSSSSPNSTSSSPSSSSSTTSFRLPNPFAKAKENPPQPSGKPTPPTLTAEERSEVEKAQQDLQEISSRINTQRRELKASIDEANKRRREAQELGKRIQKRTTAENAEKQTSSPKQSRERDISEVHSAKDEIAKPPAPAQRRIPGNGKVESAWMSLNGVPIPRLETLIAPFTKKD